MKRGTLVLSPFPFTDLPGRKVQPCLVVSRSDQPGSDVIVAFITTQGSVHPDVDLVVEPSDDSFSQTGLKARSIIKLDKVVTIEKAILLGEPGEISPSLMLRADDRLRYALSRTASV